MRILAYLVVLSTSSLGFLPTGHGQVDTTAIPEKPLSNVGPMPAIDLSSSDWFDLDRIIDAEGQDTPAKILVELPPQMSDAAPVFSSQLSPEMTGWVRWLLLNNLPEAYENNKKWGLQKEVFDGLDVDLDGLKLKTKRRYKLVNHGTWSRYYAELIDPQDQLIVSVDQLEQTGPQSFRFAIMVEAPLHVFGRVSRYQWDVQLLSISADAQARARMSATIETTVKVSPLSLTPEVTFQPRVTKAKAELIEFRVRRISQISGPLAKQLGHILREILEDKIRDYDDRLVEKMNRQLEKQSDHLRLSMGDWLESKIPALAESQDSAAK